ncbi:hypothetical protein [Kribbella ginsengisoli]|uniref:Uncharacterized protein n=1 Tax=Kribbella ginsengisoli TaxID=363865 RepID=A0ABP6Z568_9ACTN
MNRCIVTAYAFSLEVILPGGSEWQTHSFDLLVDGDRGFESSMEIQHRKNTDPEATPADLATKVLREHGPRALYRTTWHRSAESLPQKVRVRLWIGSGTAEDPAVMIEAHEDLMLQLRLKAAAIRCEEARQAQMLMDSQYRGLVAEAVWAAGDRSTAIKSYASDKWPAAEIEMYVEARERLEALASAARSAGIGSVELVDWGVGVPDPEDLRIGTFVVSASESGRLTIETHENGTPDLAGAAKFLVCVRSAGKAFEGRPFDVRGEDGLRVSTESFLDQVRDGVAEIRTVDLNSERGKATETGTVLVLETLRALDPRRDDTDVEIVVAIKSQERSGGASSREVADLVGRHRTGVDRRLRRLGQLGVVERAGRGRFVIGEQMTMVLTS